MSKVTHIRTLRIKERPNLLWVEVKTEDGLVGLGETFRAPEAAEAIVHDLIAPHLLGQEADEIERLSGIFTNQYVGFGGSSAEMRAASAVDIALWDLKGKRFGTPIWNLLGGLARRSVQVYNTCAGYSYNSNHADRRMVDGKEAAVGPYDDQVAFMRDAGELAKSLVDEGYRAMKIWPFDIYAKNPASHNISLTDLKAGLAPFAKIRKAVWDRIDVMCELHSMWGGSAALRICRGLEDYGVFWAEDPICKSNDTLSLASLRQKTATPICVSETLGGLTSFRDALVQDAVDYVMIDLNWCGGFTIAKKIAALAESFSRPVAPHDCTGPVALMAGLHFSLSSPTAIFQEVVRAYMTTWYADLVTGLPKVENGELAAPQAPGLGMELRPELWERKDAVVRASGAPV